MSLYFQPSRSRANDNALPTAPDRGVDVGALIDELTNRINEATRKIEHKVDSKALAKIILTDRDIVLMGDQVNIVGQLNIVDWIRDISGNPTGGIDRSSITRITGGKIQTGIIESVNWSTTQGSQFDLDVGTIVTGGSLVPKFSVDAQGVMTCQDAVVRGTITAGSFIQSTVRLDDEFGPTLGELAIGTDIQGALNAGVTNILAGVGSNFRLNVDTANALVTFQHKDAVFLGTAAPGSVKPGLGISSSGIGMGYNRSSDGLWVTTLTLDAAGNLAMTGTLTAGSIIVSSVTVNGVSLGTISTRALDGFNINDRLTNGGTQILRGVLLPDSTGAIKTGTIVWNTATGSITSGSGVAMTEFGILAALNGSPTFTLNGSTGAATFRGDITGGANIDISGTARFNGNTSSYAITAGDVGINGVGGISARSRSSFLPAVRAECTTAGGVSLTAVANSSSITALQCSNGLGGIALDVIGRMAISSSSLVTNLNADLLDNKQGSGYCQTVVPETGACTISGGGFVLISNVTSQQVRGNNSNGLIIETISDERTKFDIEPEVFGIDFINSINFISFRSKSKPGLKYHGWTAQNLIPLMDGKLDDALLHKNPEDLYGSDYISLIGPMGKSIQYLYNELEAIKQQLAT